MAIVVLIIAAIIAFSLRHHGRNEYISLLVPSLIIPVFILIDMYVLPYHGGGASFWPLEIIFGSFYGFMASGVGVALASFILKRHSQRSNNS